MDLRDFRPTPTQARLLKSTEPYVLFAAGYGAGKTRSGAEKALRLALANPGCTGLLAAPTWQMLTRLSLDAFLRACPKQLIAEHHKSERRIELVNGSRIYFGSADKAGALEGTNLAWAWIDEARLVSHEAWQVIVGRVRDRRARQMQVVVTTTPAMGWLSDFWDGRDGRLALHCSTAENAANLAPGFIERLRASYSARLAKSLIDGEFTVLQGAVYEELEEARHSIAWEYDPRWRTGLAMDFGVNAPAVLFWQETGDFPWTLPDGRTLPPRSIVIFDELHPDQTPTERLVHRIDERLAGRRIDAVFCDPAGAARDQATGIPSVAMLERAFGRIVRYETNPAERWIPNGVERVRAALSPADGSAPRLYVAEGLWKNTSSRGLVRSLRAYHYPERDGRVSSDQPVKDGVSDHMADAARYLVLNAENARCDGSWRTPVRLAFGGG